MPLLVLLSGLAYGDVALLLLTGYPLLGIRVWRHRRSRGDDSKDAALYAMFILIGKFANFVGLAKFYLNRYAGRYEIIEYK